MSLDLFRTKARPSTPHRPTHSVHGFPRPLRFRLMSCLLPIRPHRTGFKASSCCTAGEERCVSSFASIRWTLCILLPADLSSLTPPFFPRWLGKFDTRARRHFIGSRKEKERKNISQGLGIREKITEMEIPSSLWAKQNPGKFGPKNDRRMKPSYMSASVWPVGGEPYVVVSVFCI